MGPTPGRGMSGNMRKLHVVGFSAEQGGFILAARRGAKTGGYVLTLDEALVEQFDEARRADGQAKATPEPRVGIDSALTPREIQSRLRAGRTVEEVAGEAGVSPDWVERFAAPVLAEQIAAVERAGRATLHTPRRGPSDRPLEASVLRNLADRGIAMSDDEMRVAWSARHLVDTDWLISFRFRNRGRAMVAEWLLNAANGALTSRNRLGTELGFIEAGRRVGLAPVDSVEPVGPPGPARRRRVASRRPRKTAKVATRKASARKAVAKRAGAGPRVVKRSTGPGKAAARKRPAVTKSAAKKSPAVTKAPAKKSPAVTKAPAKKLPAVKKRAAVREAAVKKRVAAKELAAKKSAAARKAAVKNSAPVRQAAVKKSAPIKEPAAKKVPVTPRQLTAPKPAEVREGLAKKAPTVEKAPPAASAAPLPPPVGAHFAGRRRPPRVEPSPPVRPPVPNGTGTNGAAVRRPDRPLRANRLGTDLAPETGGVRFGNPE